MEYLSNLLRIIKLNIGKMFEFQIVVRIVSMAVVTPLILFMFNLTMKIGGYKYITKENLHEYICEPFTITMLLVILFCLAYAFIFEAGGIIYIIDQSYQGHKIKMTETVMFAMGNAVRVFSIRNFAMLFFVFIFSVIMNAGLATTYLVAIEIPDLITAIVRATPKVYPAICVIGVLMLFLSVRWMYFLNYFTLEKCHFSKACKKSRELNNKGKIKDLFILFLIEMFCIVLFLLLCVLLIGIVVVVFKLLERFNIPYYIFYETVVLVVNLITVIFFILIVPVLFSGISVLFYKRKEEKGEEIVHCRRRKRVTENQHRRIKKLATFFTVMSTISCTMYFVLLLTGRMNFNVEYVKTMEVTAHRGNSNDRPENSMSAFKKAVKDGADWIELDVQQTKDEEIIVLHDSSLKRTTGKNKHVWEMKYSDIRKLECGKWFSPKYEGEKIPLLSEVIDYAKKQDVKLNIEIKPSSHDTDFEEQLVDLIIDKGFEDECVVTSQSYASLKKVKDYNKEITTIYVMGVAYGSVFKLSSADGYSVKSYYVTDELVGSIHNAGKEIFVWTVNNEKLINRMIDLNVDNIITDNVSMAKKCIYTNKTNSDIVSVVNNFIIDNITERTK